MCRIAPVCEAAANLTSFRPAGWSDKIVVSKVPGTNTDSSDIAPTDTLYIDWAFLNSGSDSTATSFVVVLYVDGNLTAAWTSEALLPNYYIYVTDYALRPLTSGVHSLTLVADPNSTISESSESDNEYTKTITVSDPIPILRIDPESLSFFSAPVPATQPEPFVAPSSASSPAAEGTVAVESADKLIDSAEIRRNQEGGGAVRVIVNLAAPATAGPPRNFRSRAWRRAWQADVARKRQAALSELPRHEIRVRHAFANMTGFSAEVTPAGLAALQAHPQVSSIEPVYPLEPHLAQGISLIHGLAHRGTYDGQGLAIAICDTGLDYNHPKLGGGGFPNTKVLGGYDFGDGDADPLPNDQPHGTACGGIAAGDLDVVGDYIGGVAPKAKLYALKISEGNTGSATTDGMVAAWDWCVTHQDDNPDYPILVISTSFGGGRHTTFCDTDLPSAALAVSNAVAAGITVLASSGNDGYCDAVAWPACMSKVIAVGGVYDAGFGLIDACIGADSCANKTATAGCSTGWYMEESSGADQVPFYSNTASFLGVLAPANQCSTLDISGGSGYSAGNFTTGFGGTSAACPYAAGTVACLQSAAKALTGAFLSVADVHSRLFNYGDDVTDTKAGLTKPRLNLEQTIGSLIGPTQTLRFYNEGAATLVVNSITCETPTPWLSFAPAGGFSIAPGDHTDVIVSVDYSQAPAGATSTHVSVVSNDSVHNPYPGGVNVVVNRVNTGPNIVGPPAVTLLANGAPVVVPFSVSDAETAADLVVTASSSDTALVPASGLSLGGSGQDRTLTITPAPNRSGTCSVSIQVSDGSLSASLPVPVRVWATVVGRSVFYNESAFDGGDAAANAADDGAIATNKAALLPGATATFTNYTSYSRGLNGVMVDVAGLNGTPTSSDFEFRKGNDNTPAAWGIAPDPVSITRRAGAGVGGSDRVTLIWTNNAIQKEWLQVRVRATTTTGLQNQDLFYFGNAIGDTGDAPAPNGRVRVNTIDLSGARLHPRNLLNDPASIVDLYDFDRDGRVNKVDQSIVRLNPAGFADGLLLFTP